MQPGLSREEADHRQESLDQLLDAWVPLLQDAALLPEEPLRGAALRLFQLYLRSRLAPPDGTRTPVRGTRARTLALPKLTLDVTMWWLIWIRLSGGMGGCRFGNDPSAWKV